MKRDSIDFHAVTERHEPMHERLQNWGRAQHGRASSAVQPMFRGYRSTDVWAAAEPRKPLDMLDAAKVQRGVVQLPQPHRLALHWAYVHPWVPVWRIRRAMAMTEQALWQTVSDGRTMLVNKRV